MIAIGALGMRIFAEDCAPVSLSLGGSSFTGAGRYSTRTLLMIGDGAPGRRGFAAGGRGRVEHFAEDTDLVTAAGIAILISSLPSGATALTPPGPAPPEIRS